MTRNLPCGPPEIVSETDRRIEQVVIEPQRGETSGPVPSRQIYAQQEAIQLPNTRVQQPLPASPPFRPYDLQLPQQDFGLLPSDAPGDFGEELQEESYLQAQHASATAFRRTSSEMRLSLSPQGGDVYPSAEGNPGSQLESGSYMSQWNEDNIRKE